MYQSFAIAKLIMFQSSTIVELFLYEKGRKEGERGEVVIVTVVVVVVVIVAFGNVARAIREGENGVGKILGKIKLKSNEGRKGKKKKRIGECYRKLRGVIGKR